MTQEEKQIAIAEACGWKYVNTNKHTWLDPQGQGEPFHKGAPDFLNDLNAMHKAEFALGLKYDQWTRELRGVCERERRCVESATAAQRAEAFGLTLNLWK